MSREIKFRAWDKVAKRILPVDSINFSLGGELKSIRSVISEIEDSVIFGEDFELLQFTGLKDKNGKEIYEGDIVCSDRYSAPNFEVVFHEGAFRGKDNLGRVMTQVTNGTEVIGNIYENPELLDASASRAAA